MWLKSENSESCKLCGDECDIFTSLVRIVRKNRQSIFCGECFTVKVAPRFNQIHKRELVYRKELGEPLINWKVHA